MFTLSSGLLFGILAIVVDVGNIWNTSLHVQHAAEAAALAGVPYMPGDFATASSKAQAEAAKNGYSAATGATVTPATNVESNRRLDVLGHDRRADLLPAGHRDEQGPDHPHRDRRVHPAGPDGQPAQHVRRQLRLLLGRGRGRGDQPLRRRRLRHLLQPEPDREQPVRPERLPVRDRRARRGRGDEHRPLRPDLLRCRRPEGNRRPLDRLEPRRLAGGVDLLHALVRPGFDTARLLGRRGRRLDRHAVREQAPGRQERSAARGLGDLADPCLLEPARLHDRPVPQPVVDVHHGHHARAPIASR